MVYFININNFWHIINNTICFLFWFLTFCFFDGLELEKNNYVDVQPYKTQNEKYITSIPTPQAIADQAKQTLNLDDNEYNDLDKDENINIKF